jgi:hypothetical protein
MKRMAVLAMIAALLALASPTAALPQPVQTFVGNIQWISGSALFLGGPNAIWFGSLKVDISRIPQAQLTGLRSGDEIIVHGYVPSSGVTREGYRVIGVAIERPVER